MCIALKIFLPFYLVLHVFMGLPLAVLTGVIGGIIDRTTFYFEMEMSDWVEEFRHPYRLF